MMSPINKKEPKNHNNIFTLVNSLQKIDFPPIDNKNQKTPSLPKDNYRMIKVTTIHHLSKTEFKI